MSLTKVVHCFAEAGDDVLCLAQNPRHRGLVLAGSQDNALYVLDVDAQQCVAKITDFADSVTHAKWLGPAHFMASSLDGSLRVYRYDADAMPVPIRVAESLDQGPIGCFKTQKSTVYAQGEDD